MADQLSEMRNERAALIAERDALRAEVERLRAQVPVWISVKEQLPQIEAKHDSSDEVLVCGKGWCEVGFYNRFANRWANSDGTEEMRGVTHWLPLPAAPGTDESEADSGQ